MHLSQDQLILEAVKNSPKISTGLEEAAKKLGRSFYSVRYRYYTYLRPAESQTTHPKYRHIEEPYDAEKIKRDRWYFADVCKEMADRGICTENIARQFGLKCRTVDTWIRLAWIFPPEHRCTEFAPYFYGRLLKYDDPVKALQICREIKKLDPGIVWWSTGSAASRKTSGQKVPVAKLQKILEHLVEKKSLQVKKPKNINSFIDPEWLREVTARVAQLEQELQAARKLNLTYLKMLSNQQRRSLFNENNKRYCV